MAEYLTNTTDLTKVASAIREKGGTSDPLVYPDGFVTAIGNIQTGGGTAADIEYNTITPDFYIYDSANWTCYLDLSKYVTSNRFAFGVDLYAFPLDNENHIPDGPTGNEIEYLITGVYTEAGGENNLLVCGNEAWSFAYYTDYYINTKQIDIGLLLEFTKGFGNNYGMIYQIIRIETSYFINF